MYGYSVLNIIFKVAWHSQNEPMDIAWHPYAGIDTELEGQEKPMQ